MAHLTTDDCSNCTGIAPTLDDASRLRVLVVDDNQDVAESQASLLQLMGHAAEVAHTGAAALAIADERHPDVILLDIGMPDMDGWEVARALREQKSPKRPFVIALSGFGQAEDMHQSAEAGIDLHLLKPADPDQLDAILRRFHRVIR
jgi:CheY-like chemotaxis protein